MNLKNENSWQFWNEHISLNQYFPSIEPICCLQINVILNIHISIGFLIGLLDLWYLYFFSFLSILIQVFSPPFSPSSLRHKITVQKRGNIRLRDTLTSGKEIHSIILSITIDKWFCKISNVKKYVFIKYANNV